MLIKSKRVGRRAATICGDINYLGLGVFRKNKIYIRCIAGRSLVPIVKVQKIKSESVGFGINKMNFRRRNFLSD